MATEIDCDLQNCINNPETGPCTSSEIELTIDSESGFLDCFQYETEIKSHSKDMSDQLPKLIKLKGRGSE